MIKKEIGRFYAFTFDNGMFEFIVYDNDTIDCPTIARRDFRRIYLKPRFEMTDFDKRYYTYGKDPTPKEKLIKQYAIVDELFDYLLTKGMIAYSSDMAYLYDFKEKDGYDRKYYEGKPFKWASKKGPILVKQKKGEFN